MTLYNPNLDLVNDSMHTKFGLILSIHSQDIEQKPNYEGMTERENDRQGVSVKGNRLLNRYDDDV